MRSTLTHHFFMISLTLILQTPDNSWVDYDLVPICHNRAVRVCHCDYDGDRP